MRCIKNPQDMQYHNMFQDFSYPESVIAILNQRVCCSEIKLLYVDFCTDCFNAVLEHTEDSVLKENVHESYVVKKEWKWSFQNHQV